MENPPSKIKICVISTWFGKLPPYLPYLLISCAFNKEVDWLFIADWDLPQLSFENIKIKKMSQKNFADIASEQLGFKVSIEDPYKICDFKPIFGKIYNDLLYTYEYWGYCDLDMVFGNISKFLMPILNERPDIVSFYPDFMSGPFCLYKNSDKVNNLYKKCPDYKTILQDPEHRAFDENIPKRLTDFRYLWYSLLYLLKLIFLGPRYKLYGPDIRYHFQWYVKQLNSRRSQPTDMTEIVHKASRARQIKVIFKDLIRSDRAYNRAGRKHWEISWKNGYLATKPNAEEILAYHFVETKKNSDFIVDSVPDFEGGFIISDKHLKNIRHGAKEK